MLQAPYTLYEKRGRRYYPVSEYDPKIHNSFPDGFCMVHTHPAGRSYQYAINPAYAEVQAAIKVCKDRMLQAMMAASSPNLNIKNVPKPYPPEISKQLEILSKMMQEMFTKEGLVTGTISSANEIVEAGLKVIEEHLITEVSDEPRI